MPVETEEKTFRYQVETDQGTFELELDAPVPEGDTGRRMLESLLHEQLSQGPFGETPRDEFPITAAAGDIGRGVVGGLRDFGQQFLDLPADIVNTITEFISPDPPGPPGTRRRVVREITAPQLPDPAGEPKSGLERGIRTALPYAIDAGLVLTPIAKGILARRAAKRAARRTPMTFEKGSVARDMEIPRGRRTDLRLEASSPASRPASRYDKAVPTRGEATGILKTPPSEAARRMAPLFDFQAERIPTMTLKQATEARRRIISRIPDYELYVEDTPIFELMQRLEQHILSFR